jgi:hypothetical protein
LLLGVELGLGGLRFVLGFVLLLGFCFYYLRFRLVLEFVLGCFQLLFECLNLFVLGSGLVLETCYLLGEFVTLHAVEAVLEAGHKEIPMQAVISGIEFRHDLQLCE